MTINWPLPGEITQQVFSHMAARDVLACQRVIRFFAQQGADHLLWTRFCQRDFGVIPSDPSKSLATYKEAYRRARNIAKAAFREPFPVRRFKLDDSKNSSIHGNYMCLGEAEVTLLKKTPGNPTFQTIRHKEGLDTVFQLCPDFLIGESDGNIHISVRDGDDYFRSVYSFHSLHATNCGCFDDDTIYISHNGRMFLFDRKTLENRSILNQSGTLMKSIDDYLCFRSMGRWIVLQKSRNFEQVGDFGDVSHVLFAHGIFYTEVYSFFARWIKDSSGRFQQDPLFREEYRLVKDHPLFLFTWPVLNHIHFTQLEIRDKNKVDLPLIQTLQFEFCRIRDLYIYQNYLITANNKGVLTFFRQKGDKPGFIETPVKEIRFESPIKLLHVIADSLVVITKDGTFCVLDLEG